MKYSLVIILFLSLFLVSCWEEEPIETKTRNSTWEKTSTKNKSIKNSNDFLIEAKKISNFDNSSSIQKIGKIISNQNLDIKSQVSWKISKIYVKNGEKIKAWVTIAKIKDSYSKYYLDLDKAKIDFDKQLINKDSQILSLDQKITDTKISLEDAKKNLENAKKTAANDRKKATLDFENTKTTAENDRKKAELDLGNNDLITHDSQAKLELEKAELDYQNTLNSNKEKINWYIQNIKKDYNNLELKLVDIIRFSDELLWVTSDNRDKSKIYKDYLWAKDSVTKSETKTKLSELITYSEELSKLDSNNISEENLLEFMLSFYEWYWKINSLLESLEKTLENSISSVWAFSQDDIDWFISDTNSYQSSNQSNLSSFTSTQNSISSFLNTYKDSELSSLKNVELQKIKLENSSESSEITYDKTISSIDNSLANSEISYNKTVVSIDNSLNSYETRFKQAEQAYNNALKNKKITIRSLNNSISSAKNSKTKASVEFSKLNIISPISWVISSIDIDESADVSSWTKLFTIISDTNTQIEVSLNKDEISQVNIWDKVKVEYWKDSFSWEVYSKSNLANDILDYNVVIVLNKKIDLLWGSTIVNFSWKNSSLLLPLDIVTVDWDNSWTINVLKNWKNETLKIDLWKIEWNNVEVLSEIPEDTKIIITDLKNFNKLTQTLKIK